MWFCPVGYHLWVAYAQRLLVLSTRVSLLQARAAAQLATLSGCTQPEGALYRQRSALQRVLPSVIEPCGHTVCHKSVIGLNAPRSTQ